MGKAFQMCGVRECVELVLPYAISNYASSITEVTSEALIASVYDNMRCQSLYSGEFSAAVFITTLKWHVYITSRYNPLISRNRTLLRWILTT